jgi:DNA-binding winged helix-turn-helix (wHTH) protein/Tol biopolymer transport system component
MLNSHRNLLEPRPSDRLRIGERIVDIPLREIAPADGGTAMRVTLKSLGVLLALVAHAGRPVSREALIEWVWPDTLPTDDVLTQAIAQLRKALGDDRERPRYIETLAKQGYRLIAPVAWVVDDIATPATTPAIVHVDAAPAVAASVVAPVATRSRLPRSPGRRRALNAAAVALVVGLFALGYRLDIRPRAETVAAMPPPRTAESLTFQRVASLPVAEERPSLSPDGALIVYTRSDDSGGAPLMLQTSVAMPPRALTEPVPRRYDLLPAWSPDGRQIAFVRRTEDRCLIMAIPAAGGDARELGECLGGELHPVSWYPDGDALIAAYRMGFGSTAGADKALYRMTLAAGRWERIPYRRSPADEDMSPAVSPDGRWIAFQRNVSLADLWRVPVEGGTPERITRLRTNIYGLAWTPDGRGLVFARYADGRAVLSTVDLDTRQVVDHAGGEDGFMYPSVAARARAIAFEVGNTRSIARRATLADGDEAIVRSRTLFETTGSNLLPAVSPDGTEVLFVSDRTGDMRLWWQDQTRPDSLRAFDGFIPMPRHPAMWHADGRRALVLGRMGDGPLGVYELEPRRGRLTRLPVPDADPVHVAWHPDPNRLLVVSDHGDGRLGATLYDRSRTPWRSLARAADVAVAVVDARHRRIVLAGMSSPEIRSADLDLGQVRIVDRVRLHRRNRSLVATEDGVRVMDAGDCHWHWRRVATVPATPKGDADDICLGGPRWQLEGVSYSPADRSVYLSAIEEMQSDIGVASMADLRELAPTFTAQADATH